MAAILPILLFILVLSFLVIIHELGHFLVARFFKVRVEEFGIGYPPRALKLFRWGETLFSLNWIPFGGFVKMEGEEGSPSEDAPAVTHPQAFYQKSRFARVCIILAGAAVNFLFGIVAFSLFFSIKGIPTLVPEPRIVQVAVDSPAAQSQVPNNVTIKGFQLKDQFTNTATAEEVISFITAHPGEYATLVTTGQCQGLDCDSRLQEFDVYLRTPAETPTNQGSLGVQMEPVIYQKFYPWPEMPVRGAWYGIQQTFYLSSLILQGLGQISQQALQGHAPAEVAGPVGIYAQAQKAGFLSGGVWELLNFAALLSVNLTVMNVLPFPALDGGRLLFIILELLIGKKRVQRVEGYANYAGFALLLALVGIITLKDISGLIK